ncbi:DNA polymerase III subunit alpha [Effusibacillus consociatus]
MLHSRDDFVHLHVHTEYSFPEAVCRLDELLRQAADWNMTTLAITDKNSINGAIRFSQLAAKYGIHPIIGCEIDREETHGSLILLACNASGYQYIVECLNSGSIGRQSSSGDVIALSGGQRGLIHRLLENDQVEAAREKALEYVKMFGQGNFYLEVQNHGLPKDSALIEKTVQLSESTGIPLVATHDVHYIRPEDANLVHLPATGSTDKQAASGLFYLPSPLEMKRKFSGLPDALTNTAKIARRCKFTIEHGKHKLPKFPVPEGSNEENYLKHLCLEGLRKRFEVNSLSFSQEQMIRERLNYELSVIFSRGLASYFLIVWDLVQFARKKGIPIGPGRGSSAGSLVVYLLGITQVNPLEHGLSFERFLSLDRTELPDIDLDVCQKRRPEVLRYIKEKYGSDRVAHIGVVNTFGTRGAVREAGKYLQLPTEHVNLLAKLLPAFSGTGGIAHCLQTLPELQNLPLHKQPYKSLFRLAEQIEGLPRNYSTHPSGLLIGHEDLARTIPIQQTPNGEWMTPLNKDDLKALGFLKVDVLGLRTLTVIEDTFRSIKELTGKELSVSEIPLDDPASFQTLGEGDTLGCFQLESMGLRSLMRRMKPKHLEDLTALLSLYRPGAWEEGIVETYLRRRSGEAKADFLLPAMESILSPTFGVILYQEQVMQIANVVAGYSMGEADALRRALSKKSVDALALHRERFLQGAMRKAYSKEEASHIFEFLTCFAGYSFNKAHSTAYAYISYWTVYLKTHYPKEYMAALLSSEGGYYDRRVYLRETARKGIRFLRPDVNISGLGFRAEKKGIRVGMDVIKGTGPDAVAALLDSRRKQGHFASVQDLVERMKTYRIKGPILKSWIEAGACDSLGDNRRKMVVLLGKSCSSQMELFHENSGENEDSAADFSAKEKRRMEKALLGFALEQSPSNEWSHFLNHYGIVPIASLGSLRKDGRVRIAGTIIHSRRQPAANGQYVLILVLQDDSEMAEVILYPETYKNCLYELNPAGIVVEGVLRRTDGSLQICAEKIKALGG